MATAWKSSLKDSIYKTIYNKTTAPAKMKSKPEGKKKKKKTKTKKRTQKKSDPPRSRNPGRAACVARPATRSSGRATQVMRPLIWSPSLWSDSFSLYDLIRSSEVRLRLRLNVFKIFLFINRVLETRFSNGCHVEKDAT